MSWTDDFRFMLEPVGEGVVTEDESPSRLSNIVAVHGENHFPDLESVKLVILGVRESRRSNMPGAKDAPDEIRKRLYAMHYHGEPTHIADLGNIAPGDTPEDTDHAVMRIIASMLERKITVLILGGTQELTLANYRAYESKDTSVNITLIDSRPDMGEFRDKLTPENYFGKIVIHDPGYLFNASLLGYQTFYTEPDMLEVFDKLFFDTHRLGEVVSDISRCEPLIRNADLVSVDMGAVRDQSAPGTGEPNGLSGEQICAMARYAGLSDKTGSFGIYNYDPTADVRGIHATLVAQMAWYFIDGFSRRTYEFPLINTDKFLEYNVHSPGENSELIFYKSKRTDKWWMKVPYAPGADGARRRHHLVPCSLRDYELAGKGEVPDMWWKTYRKLG